MRNDILENLAKIVATLKNGDLVVMRVDTIYGICCLALSETAVKKLKNVRDRESKQGLIMLVDSVETVAKMINLDQTTVRRLKNIWPRKVDPNLGATSVILSGESLKQSWLGDSRFETREACFRVPNDETLRKLLRETGPLCAPSANPHGKDPAMSIREARDYFGGEVQLYVDGGECGKNCVSSRMIKFREDGSVETVRSDGLAHPEDFVISRKRKLYKFAKFLDDPRCFDLEKWRTCREKILDKNREIIAEIGAGSATFLTELAARNPEKIYVAMDRKSDRLWQGAKKAAELNLANIFFAWVEAAKLNQVFAKNSLREIWLNFPDPFAKDNYQKARAEFAKFWHDNLRFSDDENYKENLKTYEKKLKEFSEKSRKNYQEYLSADQRKRLTSEKFLESYEKLFRENSILNFKTDNAPMFEWSLKNFAKNKWKTEFISRDLHAEKTSKNLRKSKENFAGESKENREGYDENFLREAQIMTTYEEKFASEGWPIYFARFTFK